MKLYEILDGERKEKSFSCIYKWTNLINRKVYVGQTQNFYNRMKQYKNYGATPKLQNSINKHGIDNFDIEIIELCGIEKLDEREQYWMDYYCSYNPEYGYNISPTAGTTRGFKHSEEELEKISYYSKQRWQNPEYRQKQSERMSGEKNYFYDRHFCEKLNPRWGKHCTEETKEKIRNALIGKPNYACSIRIKCVETGEEFYSMTAAAKALGAYTSAIKLAVDNPKRTCKGFHFIKIS